MASKLWTPLKVGTVTLQHRLVMAPLTRYRNDDNHIPQDMMAQYYSDRASTPGTLIISEATGISPAAEADHNLPGISSPEQIAGWKRIYEAVHARGSFMFQQLWDMGRAANPEYVASRGYKYASSTAKQLENKPVAPEALTEEEIWQKIDDFRRAARNVIDAGGDGVEIHGAHGYLIDQFTRDSVNDRTDRWGGSVENRSRFLLEVLKAVVQEVGAEHVALRLSPFAHFQGSFSSDTWAQTTYIFRQIKEAGYKLAYLSLVEPRGDPKLVHVQLVNSSHHSGLEQTPGTGKDSIDGLLEEWDNWSPVFIAGGYAAESVVPAVDEWYAKYDVAIALGRYFLANPDLVARIKNGVPLNAYNRATFYLKKSNVGYNDYPFASQVAPPAEKVAA